MPETNPQASTVVEKFDPDLSYDQVLNCFNQLFDSNGRSKYYIQLDTCNRQLAEINRLIEYYSRNPNLEKLEQLNRFKALYTQGRSERISDRYFTRGCILAVMAGALGIGACNFHFATESRVYKRQELTNKADQINDPEFIAEAKASLVRKANNLENYNPNPSRLFHNPDNGPKTFSITRDPGLTCLEIGNLRWSLGNYSPFHLGAAAECRTRLNDVIFSRNFDYSCDGIFSDNRDNLYYGNYMISPENKFYYLPDFDYEAELGPEGWPFGDEDLWIRFRSNNIHYLSADLEIKDSEIEELAAQLRTAHEGAQLRCELANIEDELSTAKYERKKKIIDHYKETGEFHSPELQEVLNFYREVDRFDTESVKGLIEIYQNSNQFNSKDVQEKIKEFKRQNKLPKNFTQVDLNNIIINQYARGILKGKIEGNQESYSFSDANEDDSLVVAAQGIAEALQTKLTHCQKTDELPANLTESDLKELDVEQEFKNRLVTSIFLMKQSVYHNGADSPSKGENFLTREMAEEISNGLLSLASDLNIDIVDFFYQFDELVSERTIAYYPDEQKEHADIQSLYKKGRIRIWGDDKSKISYLLTHEFLHAFLTKHYPLQYAIPQYEEGLTHLLTIVSSCRNNPHTNHVIYEESTLLTVASGVWGEVVRNSQSKGGKPVTLEELFAVPDIKKTTGDEWGTFIDTDKGNRIFIRPQADEYVLGPRDRRRDSIAELRYYIHAEGRDWKKFKQEAIGELLVVVKDPRAIPNIEKHLKQSWAGK